MYGVPMSESRERFEEAIGMMLKMWTQERFTFQGDFFRINDAWLVPRPVSKPHPEIFLTGAKELGVPPQECFVVEDAVTGIQAAKAGGMAALGLSRAHDEELLAAAEPDVLVTSLDDVDLDALAEGRLAQRGA